MDPTPLERSLEEEVEPHEADFYRRALRALNGAGIPFLVGGAFAHACHTGIRRPTKDLDLFILREDLDRINVLMRAQGWRTEAPYPHWLSKVYDGPAFIDLIFNSGNGVTPVDERWFQGNAEVMILGEPVRISNAEDCLMSKAFVMERERYDGGDVAHLLQAQAARMDWTAVLARFGPHWRVLLAHLTLFGYIYPGERRHIPGWVMARLTACLADESCAPPPADDKLCAGTLLSREQYLPDVEQRGYVDGRLTPASTMTAEEVAIWTEAIGGVQPPRGG